MVQGCFSKRVGLPLVQQYSSRPIVSRSRLSEYSQDCGNSKERERSQTVTSYYNQSAIDAAAAKVREEIPLRTQFIIQPYFGLGVKVLAVWLPFWWPTFHRLLYMPRV